MTGHDIVLAYKVKWTKWPEKLYRYQIAEEDIAKVRNALIRAGVPHHITRPRDDSTGIDLITPIEVGDLDLELNLGLTYDGEAQVDDMMLSRLVASAARIALYSEGWLRGATKMYSRRRSERLCEEHYFNKYDATVINADFINDTPVVFVDAAYKIEPTITLEKLGNQVEPDEVKLVVRGKPLPYKFQLVRNEQVEKYYYDVNKRGAITKALSRCLDEELSVVGDYVVAIPWNTMLNNCLKKVSTGAIKIGDRVVVPIPKRYVAPLPTSENVAKLCGRYDVGKLKIPPKERLNKVTEIVDDINRGLGKIVGLDFEIDTQPIEINAETVIIGDRYVQVDGKSELGDLTHWSPKLDGRLAVVRLNVSNNSEVGLVLNNIRAYFKSQHIIKSARDVSEAEDVLKSIKGQANYVVFLHCDNEAAMPQLWYMAAKLGMYPHDINLCRNTQALRYKVRNVARELAVRSRQVPHRIVPPETFRDYSIVGIDATMTSTRKGAVYTSVSMVIVKPGEGVYYEVMPPRTGYNDIEALKKALEKAKSNYGKLIAVINKASIAPFLDENETAIVVGATKTHYYSRILRRDGRVSNSKWGKFVELQRRIINGVEVRRFLAVGTYERDNGTYRTVLYNIAGPDEKLARELLGYLFNLALFAPVGNPPSLPWPLYRADKMCKTVHRLLKAGVDSGDLTEEVLRRL